MEFKQIYDLIAPTVRVRIKPSGRRLYFDGQVKEVPQALMDAVITEIQPSIYDDDSRVLSVWVEPIKEFDLIVDALPDMFDLTDKQIGALLDGIYSSFINDPETYERDCNALIMVNRIQRFSRHFDKN